MSGIREQIAWAQRLLVDFQRRRVALAAGGLAYFVALAIAPAALAFGILAGLVLDPDQVRGTLERLAERAPEAGDALRPLMEAVLATIESASATTYTVTTAISVVLAIYAASKVAFGLRLALNTVYDVEERRSGLVERAVAAVATLVLLVVAVGLVVVATFLPSLWSRLGLEPPGLLTGNGLVDWLVIAAGVFGTSRLLIGRASSQRRVVPWTSRGVLVASVGILAVTAGVGVYARVSATMGAAVLVFGTAIVVLLWVYLCFLALLWGAVVEADDARRRPRISGRTSEVDPPRAQ